MCEFPKSDGPSRRPPPSSSPPGTPKTRPFSARATLYRFHINARYHQLAHVQVRHESREQNHPRAPPRASCDPFRVGRAIMLLSIVKLCSCELSMVRAVSEDAEMAWLAGGRSFRHEPQCASARADERLMREVTVKTT
ncbi:unnamed protein product [Peniophora sp. CBMAI 1063]|nr:unnamed protein product [Peniophora sp. CBMAI 1063]